MQMSRVRSSILTLSLLFGCPALSSELSVRGEIASSSYIIGPGDRLFIELFGIPELTGEYSVGPDGTMYLPRLRSLYVEGLSVDELRLFVEDQYRQYIKSPQVFVSPSAYRDVRVYVGGEVERPGYYTLSNSNQSSILYSGATGYEGSRSMKGYDSSTEESFKSPGISTDPADTSFQWPRLFDALRAGSGVTQYSDLSNVSVIRKQSASKGSAKLKADINFSRLLTENDETVNIRIFDGDIITVGKSKSINQTQLSLASRSNLFPLSINVFVSGSVKEPGIKVLPQGVSLNQAIAASGGKTLLAGRIEFIRFGRSGESDIRKFSLNESAEPGTYKNPFLMAGDIIRIRDSSAKTGIEVLNALTGPTVGIYSVYSLFKP